MCVNGELLFVIGSREESIFYTSRDPLHAQHHLPL